MGQACVSCRSLRILLCKTYAITFELEVPLPCQSIHRGVYWTDFHTGRDPGNVQNVARIVSVVAGVHKALSLHMGVLFTAYQHRLSCWGSNAVAYFISHGFWWVVDERACCRGIIDAVSDKTRVGVCLDTCHLYAAGYDIASLREAYEAVMKVGHPCWRCTCFHECVWIWGSHGVHLFGPSFILI